MNLKEYVRDIPDFPKTGILFRDITPLLAHPRAFEYALDQLKQRVELWAPTAIVAIESRGFIFGSPLACALQIPFIPIRKPGKLPSVTKSVEYSLEYGSGRLDIHADSLGPSSRALVVDDLLATGGTAAAAGELIRQCGALVAGYAFFIELTELGGRKALNASSMVSLIEY